ncbi:ATP-dependent RNA helicase DDX24-like [Xenia sp. Carnegie-2017]|uniref:ATP-dependent RNA helicase DDX24-like n=1 Tax=Xenia sp. Carnegie-2017 TaxID=2897299 RepID=UPI001F049310|nr:ATP-dependent RNA helicase DDX24-like [Xenia sp. Carnegie-2017]
MEKGSVTCKRKRKQKWRPVVLDSLEFFQGNMAGFVSLEVLEDEDIDNETVGKVFKMNKNNSENVLQETKAKKKRKKNTRKKAKITDNEKEEKTIEISQSNDNQSDTDFESEWTSLGISVTIAKHLHELGFDDPTIIQKKSIPPAILNRVDIIGAAETGSGKTLAYGLPVLQKILDMRLNKSTKCKLTSDCEGMLALILTPTRELALQVYKNIQDVAKEISVKVACVVGGMSEEKQQRVLKTLPEVVVATPGRFWYLIQQGEEHLSNFNLLQSVVIDEADRMIQTGHFQELSFVMEKINNSSEKMLSKLQKFVFPRQSLIHPRPEGKKKILFNATYFTETLLKKIGLREKSKVIDLSRKSLTVERLTESKLMCSVQDKDVYLYYFLKKHPMRTLVFVNTIDTLRRLLSLLNLLKLSPLALHAGMQQRQRLKNLDRFKSKEDGLLLASDVAARGLDIKGVQHVIHYQVPKLAEVYVHRSGRTARINNEGLSLLLISPDDLRSYEKIWKSLDKDYEPTEFPVDMKFLNDIRKRVSLARIIDKEEHRFRKRKWNNDWFLNNAKEADLEIDEDLLEDLGDSHEQQVLKKKLSANKARLNSLLAAPFACSGFAGKYPTKERKLQSCGSQYISNVERKEEISGHKAVKTKNKSF